MLEIVVLDLAAAGEIEHDQRGERDQLQRQLEHAGDDDPDVQVGDDACPRTEQEAEHAEDKKDEKRLVERPLDQLLAPLHGGESRQPFDDRHLMREHVPEGEVNAGNDEEEETEHDCYQDEEGGPEQGPVALPAAGHGSTGGDLVAEIALGHKVDQRPIDPRQEHQRHRGPDRYLDQGGRLDGGELGFKRERRIEARNKVESDQAVEDREHQRRRDDDEQGFEVVADDADRLIENAADTQLPQFVRPARLHRHGPCSARERGSAPLHSRRRLYYGRGSRPDRGAIGTAQLATPTRVEFIGWNGAVSDRVQRAREAVSKALPEDRVFAYWLCLRENVDRFKKRDMRTRHWVPACCRARSATSWRWVCLD